MHILLVRRPVYLLYIRNSASYMYMYQTGIPEAYKILLGDVANNW